MDNLLLEFFDEILGDDLILMIDKLYEQGLSSEEVLEKILLKGDDLKND